MSHPVFVLTPVPEPVQAPLYKMLAPSLFAVHELLYVFGVTLEHPNTEQAIGSNGCAHTGSYCCVHESEVFHAAEVLTNHIIQRLAPMMLYTMCLILNWLIIKTDTFYKL